MKIKYSKRARIKYPTAEIYCVKCHKLADKEDLKFGCARCQWKSGGFDLLLGEKKEDYQVFVNNFQIFVTKKVKELRRRKNG